MFILLLASINFLDWR